MTQSEFDDLREKFEARCLAIMGPKRDDYTGQSPDVLLNFKEVAERTGLTPMQAWAVYFLKHVDAITKVTCKGGSSSEPILERFADAANYISLGYALWNEMNTPSQVEKEARYQGQIARAVERLARKDEAAGWPPTWAHPKNTAEHLAERAERAHWATQGGE